MNAQSDLSSKTRVSLDEYTDTVTSYIWFCVDQCIPTKAVTSFGNSKFWFSKELAALRKKKKDSVFNGGDREKYRSPPPPDDDHSLPDRLNTFYEINSFVDDSINLLLNTAKTTKIVVDFRKQPSSKSPMHISG